MNALKALKSHKVESKLVYDCIKALNKVASRYKITLMWVPGHRGIEGNERADKLAKQGSETKFIGPEPYCGFGLSNLREKLRDWEETIKEYHKDTLSKDSQSRLFVDYSRQRTKALLDLNRNELATYTGLITGHFPVKGYLTRFKRSQEDKCRLCDNHPETTQHLLCNCENVIGDRLAFFRRDFLDPSTIRSAKPRNILSFWKKLNLGPI